MIQSFFRGTHSTEVGCFLALFLASVCVVMRIALTF